MTEGQIVKALAGFYYVEVGVSLSEDCECKKVYQCRARGIFKKEGVTPLVGDYVRFTIQDEEEGVVDEILPRRNEFIRPPVSNVDIFVVTVAAAEPEPSLEMTDRFLVTAEAADADACICINKDDLSSVQARRIASVYEGLYPTVVMSALTGEGVPELHAMIRGRSAAFAGASGVGKTSLIALLTESAPVIANDETPSVIVSEAKQSRRLETGEVSAKTGRGKHTTRHVEIFTLEDGTRVFDTPGFTSFEASLASDLEDINIDRLFPEFESCLGNCRFNDCMHENEPGCAVRDAVDAGKIRHSRYHSYLNLISHCDNKWT